VAKTTISLGPKSGGANRPRKIKSIRDPRIDNALGLTDPPPLRADPGSHNEAPDWLVLPKVPSPPPERGTGTRLRLTSDIELGCDENEQFGLRYSGPYRSAIVGMLSSLGGSIGRHVERTGESFILELLFPRDLGYPDIQKLIGLARMLQSLGRVDSLHPI